MEAGGAVGRIVGRGFIRPYARQSGVIPRLAAPIGHPASDRATVGHDLVGLRPGAGLRSAGSRLRFVEHVQEDGNAQARQQVN